MYLDAGASITQWTHISRKAHLHECPPLTSLEAVRPGKIMTD